MGGYYRHDQRLQSDHGFEPSRKLLLGCGVGHLGIQGDPHLWVTMAELVASGGKVPDLIAPFSLDRFDAFRQVNEMGATAASH